MLKFGKIWQSRQQRSTCENLPAYISMFWGALFSMEV